MSDPKFTPLVGELTVIGHVTRINLCMIIIKDVGKRVAWVGNDGFLYSEVVDTVETAVGICETKGLHRTVKTNEYRYYQ